MRYVARIPWLWVTITLFAVILMLQLAPQQVLMPELVHEHFDRGVGAYGFLVTMFGVGTVSGTLAFGQLQPRKRRGVVNYSVLAREQPRDRGARAFAVVPARGGLRARARLLRRLRRRDVGDDAAGARPDHLLSRVVSLDFFGSFGLMPVGLAFAAAIAGLASPGTIIAVGGADLGRDDRRDDDAPLAARSRVSRERPRRPTRRSRRRAKVKGEPTGETRFPRVNRGAQI